MNRLFNMDNGIFRGLSKMVDCIFLSMLFWLTCIPIFTIGTAMSAMYYTVQKVIRHDRGYVASTYWSGLKMNFKQGTVIWLIVLAVGLLLFGDVEIMKAMLEAGNKIGNSYVFFGVMLFFEMVWCIYLFPYMSRFENKNKAVMKNAAFIAILNLPWTLLIILITVVFALILYIIPMTMIIVPAVYTWVLNLILERIFRKYMSEEDKAAEDEMNREYKN